jgi:hypothetical protein
MKRLKILLLLSTLCLLPALNAVQQIAQDSTNNNFEQDISVKAYDRYTGDFYVGTGAGNGVNSIAKAGRTDTTFTGIATDANAQGAVTANCFALINNGGGAATHIAFKGAGGTATALKIMDVDGTNLNEIEAAKILDANGQQAKSFTNLAGGYKNDAAKTGIVFLRVHPAGGDGAAYSGILGLNTTTFDRVGVGDTNIAVILDGYKGEEAGDGSFLRQASTSTSDEALNAADAVVSDMHWDNELQTLFVAGKVRTHRNGQIVQAISKVKFNGDNIIISDVIPHNVNPLVANNNCIFVVRAGNSDVDKNVEQSIKHVNIYKIRTMKTSTGKYYLIVNGGVSPHGAFDDVNNSQSNRIWALRYNPDAEETIADGGTGQIVSNDNDGTVLTTDSLVFRGAAGLEGGNGGSLAVGGEAISNMEFGVGHQATDMQIIGDTVYVSYSSFQVQQDFDPGVWASTAQFDENGVIIGWTKWERVYPTVGNTNDDDRSKFFSVDAATGQIWTVPRNNAGATTQVFRSEWTSEFTVETSLPYLLKRDFSEGCFSVLDLPKGTPGIGNPGGNTRDNSLVLFGGYEKMAFARTKYGNQNNETTDFSVAENYLKVDIPGCGVVRCLGYGRSVLNNQGYFFAGTDNGLYVYASGAGLGFNGNTGLTNFDGAPFRDADNFTWQRMAADDITGPVTAIEAQGTSIFVVEQDAQGGLVSKLHRFEIGNDVATMVAAHDVIAKSGENGIPANTIFTGFKLITQTDGERISVRGLLSTSSGLYYLGPNFSWVAVDDERAYLGLFGSKRTPTTAAGNDGLGRRHVAVAAADDSSGRDYFQNSDYHLFKFNNNRDNSTDIPYTNKDHANNATALTYLDQTWHFWSDGGRRLYTVVNPMTSSYHAMRSFPFAAAEWNMTGPVNPLSSLGDVGRIFWIENISGIGVLMAGTDSGVIALQ